MQDARLRYNLAFIEFNEDGSPHMLEYPCIQSKERCPQGIAAPEPNSSLIGQFSILQNYLQERIRKQLPNYVIVFIHGWRHDARIGDSNVADLRLYAAHAARFLFDRCRSGEQRFCDSQVTAVYIGWRGARVDERRLRNWFGAFGEWLGSIATIPTLFDRKPVSEQIAPPVLSALLRMTDILQINILKDNDLHLEPPPINPNRMIVFGHSLGGNLLASALRDHYVKAIRRHEPGTYITSLVGNLVVLINPASEAANWTAIQRAIWERIAFWDREGTRDNKPEDGHAFFHDEQAPIFVSVTAARSWPPGGVRPEDCAWLRLPSSPETAGAKEAVLKLINQSDGMFKDTVEYDWATYDTFPFFKGDFRPLAQTIDRFADRIAEIGETETVCGDQKNHSWYWVVLAKPFSLLASLLRNMPFMNTDQEQTRTIGHLDPPRPPFNGLMNSTTISFKPFGTTHEMIGNVDTGDEKLTPYSDLGKGSAIICPQVPHWLYNAKRTRSHSDHKIWDHGTYWDSNDLLRPERPAAQLVHGFIDGGMAAITRANDPFWNIRAFDNALARHDGYKLTSFICAMSQLVLDDVATKPPGLARDIK
jgi:hypothetical protein